MRLAQRLNGQEMQRARFDDLLFGIPDLIAYISQVMPLQTGDVIATGTTGGVGAARSPQVWMKPGDVIEVMVDKIGMLANSATAAICASADNVIISWNTAAEGIFAHDQGIILKELGMRKANPL